MKVEEIKLAFLVPKTDDEEVIEEYNKSIEDEIMVDLSSYEEEAQTTMPQPTFADTVSSTVTSMLNKARTFLTPNRHTPGSFASRIRIGVSQNVRVNATPRRLMSRSSKSIQEDTVTRELELLKIKYAEVVPFLLILQILTQLLASTRT